MPNQSNVASLLLEEVLSCFQLGWPRIWICARSESQVLLCLIACFGRPLMLFLFLLAESVKTGVSREGNVSFYLFDLASRPICLEEVLCSI